MFGSVHFREKTMTTPHILHCQYQLPITAPNLNYHHFIYCHDQSVGVKRSQLHEHGVCSTTHSQCTLVLFQLCLDGLRMVWVRSRGTQKTIRIHANRFGVHLPYTTPEKTPLTWAPMGPILIGPKIRQNNWVICCFFLLF